MGVHGEGYHASTQRGCSWACPLPKPILQGSEGTSFHHSFLLLKWLEAEDWCLHQLYCTHFMGELLSEEFQT